jgi:ribosomal protein S18 acetylase RimI-like enzyme
MTGIALSVRRLGSDDSLAALDAIRALKSPHADRTMESLRRFLSRSENVLIVASLDGRPTGFLLAYLLDRIDVDRRMVCLYEISVATGSRRRGVGRAMIECLADLCRALDATKAWTITNRSNEAALGLFTSAGAKPGAGGDDLVLFWTADQWGDRTVGP